MPRRTGTQRSWRERVSALLLAAALLIGLAPGLAVPASAHWADAYLDKLVNWGIIRADQTGNPDAPVTRADFAAVVNRAYGYTEKGEIPFEDVTVDDWFYDDIAIAYTAGYMAGTSETTASPNETLTREMAVCILGRNMMMKETPGESLEFSDGRDISNWARGLVKTAVDNYIVSGYPDNTFAPKDPISKAQMAVLVTQCVGRPIQKSGTYELGGVFDNVTITSPGVTLRNTTISGDLYVSGGVGLGGIKLENVNVLGRIVVSGTGESERGAASVTMRNVNAREMLVDNMRNQYVTVRVDGITEIGETVVRTSAYLEDNNTDEKGMLHITMDGEEGTRLDLAGRIKEVTGKTPGATIQLGKGSIKELTVDEKAVNSKVVLDRNTEVKEMNLDVAANVTGEGDIDSLNVNAPGAVVSMLPDKIYIRPGLTASIAGVVMDHAAAEEGSLDPRLLSGYPAAKDIAPTSFRADFSGNKQGTIYWAVSSISDGSIREEDLITPPSYGSKAVRSGSVTASVGGAVVNAQVTGLTGGGSYYLSAVLVDAQKQSSPVKVISFTTPDNSEPAFGDGYPYMSFVGKENKNDAYITAQVAVMATKTCRMYYAVLPKGAAAPTANELKSASVSGNLGYGSVELVKNQAWDADDAIIVSRRLEELKDYTLYLWLTDVDGTNSSKVETLNFTTPDVTPPQFLTDPHMVGKATGTSVPMAATLNEDGTIYWVAVESGTPYPSPNNQNAAENAEDGKTARLESEYAKLQVLNGMNALSSNKVTAKANTEVKFNIDGLQAEKAYDVYYMAQDSAGNSTVQVYKLPDGVRTLDEKAPTVRQFFTRPSGQSNTESPMRSTDIILEFSENIRFANAGSRDLVSLYQDTLAGSAAEQTQARKLYTDALKGNIKLFYRDGIDRPAGVKGESDNWIIDYEQTTVTNVEGKIQLRFRNEGLNLASGGTYHFEIGSSEGITDMSGHSMSPNPVRYDAPADSGHSVPRFTVAFAKVHLTDEFTLPDSQIPQTIKNANDPNGGRGNYGVDFKFRVIPESTSTVADSMSYDLLLWTDTYMEFELYYRVVRSDGEVLTLRQNADGSYRYALPNMENKIYTAGLNGNGWISLGSSGMFSSNVTSMSGKSMHVIFNQGVDNFPKVNTLKDSGDVYYEFVASIRRLGTAGTANDPATWSGDVNLYVDVAAGSSSDLYNNLTSQTGVISNSTWEQFLRRGLVGGGGESIGAADNPDNPKRLHMTKSITDSRQPSFASTFPSFEADDTSVTMNLTLNRKGDIYYAIAKADSTGNELADWTKWVPDILTTDSDTNASINPNIVPRSGTEKDEIGMPVLSTPDKQDIYDPRGWADQSKAITGMVSYQGVAAATKEIKGLDPNTTYYVYLTVKGSGPVPSELEIYKFKTDPPKRPFIGYSPADSGMNMTTTNKDSYLYYMIYPEEDLRQIYWMAATAVAGKPSNKLKDILSDEATRSGGLPSAYANYTILEALTETYSWEMASNRGADTTHYFPTNGAGEYTPYFNGYSVFDIYAKTEVKQAIANWVTSGILPPSVEYKPKDNTTGQEAAPNGFFGGEHQIAMNQNVLGNNEVYGGGTYYVLTVARSKDANKDESAEAIYSFRAAPYRITSGAPPELVSASGNGQVDQFQDALRGGTLTLTFDKKLHSKANVALKEGEDGGKEFFQMGATDPWPAGVKTASVSHNGDSTTVRITLVNVNNGDDNAEIPITITVPYNSLMNSGGTRAQKGLKIEIYKDEQKAENTGMVQKKFYLQFYWGVTDVPFGDPIELRIAN